MLRIPLARTVVILFLSPLLWSQAAAGPQSTLEAQQKLDALRRDFKNTKKLIQSGQFGEVQTSLARFGEREPLQQILCELDFGTPGVQSKAFAKLPHVGGWFSIKALSEFLADSPSNRKSKSDAAGLFVPPQIEALKILPRVVPQPPLGVANAARLTTFDNEREQTVRTWTEWLGTYHDSLVILQPIGEGIVASEQVCRDVLKDDPDSLTYSNKKSK